MKRERKGLWFSKGGGGEQSLSKFSCLPCELVSGDKDKWLDWVRCLRMI